MINMASGPGRLINASFVLQPSPGLFVLGKNCKSIGIVYDCKIPESIFRYL